MKIYSPQPDRQAPIPPTTLYQNVLINPQLRLTPETAIGFPLSDEVLSIVTLNNKALKRQVKRNICALDGPPVKLINEIDDSCPPASFKFINENELGPDVHKIPEDFMVGCDCRPDNGRQMGCEHLKCGCVQNSDPDDKTGRRHFPYSASENNYGCLRSIYLKSRRHIYECNNKCNCGTNCKNRVVQHGRQVPLEIFKTKDRGFGECIFALYLSLVNR